MNTETDRQSSPAAFFKLLSDELRLKSLLLIEHSGELCVCELMEALDESQPKVSRHLAQLRRADILVDRRSGQWVYYSLNPALPEWMKQVLKQGLEANSGYIESSLTRLQQMGERPGRSICQGGDDV